MKNNQKGITLIALVVTIIVLLILAGVSIAMLAGEGGIMQRATTAGAQTKLADAAEIIAYDVNETVAKYFDDRYIGNNYTTAEQAETALKDNVVTAINSAAIPEGVSRTTTPNLTAGKDLVGEVKLKLEYDKYYVEATLTDEEGTLKPSVVWSAIKSK